MPRPTKFGLDYFPLDVNLDEKMELIEAKYGLVGFGIIIKLYQNIYKNGYFMDASEDRLLLFKGKVNVDINLINDVINDACRWDIFDESIMCKYHVLTSRGTQKRFIDASQRRKEVEFIEEYTLCSDLKNRYPKGVNVNINPINDNINPINTNICTQRGKGKEKNNKHTCANAHQSTCANAHQSTSDFELFYEAYPKKKNKQAALKAWKKLNGNRPDIETILAEIEKQKKTKDWQKDGGQFIPLPSTWINNCRWEDEVDVDVLQPQEELPPYYEVMN